ncbi:unnamed protein product [Alopecurus aequalis]
MALGVGGAPGASGGLGASSHLPSRPRSLCAAPLRAVVSPGAHGGGYLCELIDRLVADGYLRVVSAASCVGASSLPPPPRCAASPPALRASHGRGGGDLRDYLREVFEWLVANEYVVSVASSPPRPPRRTAPPLTLVASGGHGGGDFREVYEWLVANGYVDVASAATGLGARSPTPPPGYDAPPPAVVASDGRGGRDIRDPLHELFERLIADSYVHLALPAFGSPFRFCTINIQFRASDLLNPNAQNSKATLLITQKDRSEAYYTQGRSLFPHDYPRIQELNADGTNFNAHEEPDDLSDAPAPFITKPKVFSQLSSDIGLKSRKEHVCTTTNFNPAIRDFDHATKAQLIGSCTSVPQFFLNTDYTRRSQFHSLHHEHATRTDRRMTHEVLTCRQCETSAAIIQRLLRLNSIIEQKLEDLSEHNTVAVKNTKISGDDTGPLEPEVQLIRSRTSSPQFCLSTDNMPGLHPENEVRPPKPESDHSAEDSIRNLNGAMKAGERCGKQASVYNAPGPNSPPNPPDTESVGNFQGDKLMEKFNKLLVDCVFFALPQVLIFFPRYQASEEKPKPDQRLSLLAIIQQTDNQSHEKVAVIVFFVMFVSAWLVGLVLSLFGRGKGCTLAVSLLTLWTVGSTVALIDYMLCKCLPEAGVFTWLFSGHFVALVAVILYIWFTYVGVPKFPSLPSCQGVFDRLKGRRQTPVRAPAADVAEEKDELKEGLLPVWEREGMV